MLCALFALAVRPANPAVPGPVERDAGCAAALSARVRAEGPVRVLGCDPRGRGLAVVALGDPTTARHIAVLVPGTDIDLGHLDDPTEPRLRPLGWARALEAAAERAEAIAPGAANGTAASRADDTAASRADTTAASRADTTAASRASDTAASRGDTTAASRADDTAVVLWVGYTTPQGVGVDAATGSLARAGAPALQRFVAGLRAAHHGPLDDLTVIGHSYGSVVTAIAAHGLAADDIVLLGSPGARAHSVAALHTSARVWAARTAGDWIAHVPHLEIGDLGHGTDPVSPAFGARLLPIGGTSGHDGYFVPGSAALAGLAGVVLGRSPSPPTSATATHVLAAAAPAGPPRSP
nr:alpha/beta hydrolase [Pseudonocardia acidicola]